MERLPTDILRQILGLFKEDLDPWETYVRPCIGPQTRYDLEAVGSVRTVCKSLYEVATPLIFETISIKGKYTRSNNKSIPAYRDVIDLQKRIDELESLVSSGFHVHVRYLFVQIFVREPFGFGWRFRGGGTDWKALLREQDSRLAGFVDSLSGANVYLRSVTLGQLWLFPSTCSSLARIQSLGSIQHIITEPEWVHHNNRLTLINSPSIPTTNLRDVGSFHLNHHHGVSPNNIDDIVGCLSSMPSLVQLGLPLLPKSPEVQDALRTLSLPSVTRLLLVRPAELGGPYSTLRSHLTPFLVDDDESDEHERPNNRLTDLYLTDIFERWISGRSTFSSTDLPSLTRLRSLDTDWRTIKDLSTLTSIKTLEIGFSENFEGESGPPGQQGHVRTHDRDRDLKTSRLIFQVKRMVETLGTRTEFPNLRSLSLRLPSIRIPSQCPARPGCQHTVVGYARHELEEVLRLRGVRCEVQEIDVVDNVRWEEVDAGVRGSTALANATETGTATAWQAVPQVGQPLLPR